MFYANVPSTIFIIIINVNERIFEAEICMQNHFSDFSKRTWNKQQFILHLHSHCTRNCWFANAVKHWRIPIYQSSPYQANELNNNSLCDTPSAASNKMGKQAFCIFHWYKWVYRFFWCCPVRCVFCVGCEQTKLVQSGSVNDAHIWFDCWNDLLPGWPGAVNQSGWSSLSITFTVKMLKIHFIVIFRMLCRCHRAFCSTLPAFLSVNCARQCSIFAYFCFSSRLIDSQTSCLLSNYAPYSRSFVRLV